MCSSDRMSNRVGEVGAVGAVNDVRISNEFLPSTQEVDFDAEQTYAATPAAASASAPEYLATPSRTPGASVSATPPAAASGAASSVNALRGATSNDVSTILPLRRGTPYVPVNLSAPASHQRGLFSSSAFASALDPAASAASAAPAASAASAVSRPPALTSRRHSRLPKNQHSPRKSNHSNRNRTPGGKRRTLRKYRKQRKQRKQNKGTQRKQRRS